MNKKLNFVGFCLGVLVFMGCKKQIPSPGNDTLVKAGDVLSAEANVVISPMFANFAKDAGLMYNGAVILQASPTDANLATYKTLWLNATADYEKTCTLLFGPGGDPGGDPSSAISTYPIDTAGISSLISGSGIFTQNFIDSLPTYLTGFHGIEFEEYSITGNKTAAQFTPRQLAYITAISLNIYTTAAQMDSEWNPSLPGSYTPEFVNAGNGSDIYPDQRAAFCDLTMAITNITETDAIYKLEGIYFNKAVILQESPFANNSLVNIQNNLTGVRDVYYCQYGNNTGTSLSAFVSQSNENLDARIKTDLDAAQKAVSQITVPLSQAIYTEPTQVQLAINMSDSLNDDLIKGLLGYINSNTN